MEFCTNCQNLLQLRPQENEILYVCPCCQKEYREFSVGLVVLEEKHFGGKARRDKDNYRFAHLDPTLPRTSRYNCPNEDCSSRTEGTEKKAVFLQHDSTMCRRYICLLCLAQWNSS